MLVGAEGVVENGGIINKLGTYQLAICAKAHNIPFYAAAESYKVAFPPAVQASSYSRAGELPFDLLGLQRLQSDHNHRVPVRITGQPCSLTSTCHSHWLHCTLGRRPAMYSLTA